MFYYSLAASIDMLRLNAKDLAGLGFILRLEVPMGQTLAHRDLFLTQGRPPSNSEPLRLRDLDDKNLCESPVSN
ncbi:hypothetical protein CY34DRAFT_807421 [Suillus luteus UH-Slu-Lm8-n1]|uniref:Uncharacterized protein n=1 Tax=Suillus luteus UH-Slu-Lm8-n1 TaxID=930992 RepID=A0A0C9ZR38_9AGAM|nr:hypothetical protein CY34DRAFT_807421 [Suillus luteus UH-Slu-Lm8-n1]